MDITAATLEQIKAGYPTIIAYFHTTHSWEKQKGSFLKIFCDEAILLILLKSQPLSTHIFF